MAANIARVVAGRLDEDPALIRPLIPPDIPRTAITTNKIRPEYLW